MFDVHKHVLSHATTHAKFSPPLFVSSWSAVFSLFLFVLMRFQTIFNFSPNLSVSSYTTLQFDLCSVSASLPHAVFFLLFCLSGYREGFLWKRGRDNGQFLSRKFVLSEREGALKYFNKQDVSKMIQLISASVYGSRISMLSKASARYNVLSSVLLLLRPGIPRQ